jgi:flagellar FliL protein
MPEPAIPGAPEAEEFTKEPEPLPEKKPLIPPVLVRYSAVGGILAVLAVGAILLVTEVIAPRIRSIGAGEAGVGSSEAAPNAEAKAMKPKFRAPGEVFTVTDLVVNPAGTGGRRYLKVTAALEVHGAKAAKELELRKAQVRDLFLRDLSARTLEELTDPVAKEEMRTTILSELNEIMTSGEVSNLYFTDYVVQ